MANIISIEQLVAELGSPSGASLTIVQQVHPRVEAAVKKLLDYDPVNGTRTEFYPVHVEPARNEQAGEWDIIGGKAVLAVEGNDALILRGRPVRSITDVREDYDRAFGADTIIPASEYWLDLDEAGLSRSGILYRKYGSWPNEPRTVRVTYVAGWTAAELATGEGADLPLAVVKTVRHHLQKELAARSSGGKASGLIVSESFQGESRSYANNVSSDAGSRLPQDAIELLQQYIRYGMI